MDDKKKIEELRLAVSQLLAYAKLVGSPTDTVHQGVIDLGERTLQRTK